MTPITLDLSAIAALGELSPARRLRLASSLLAALSIAPEDLSDVDEQHAQALSRIRELTAELDAATDRAERAEAALEASSGPLSVLSAGGLAAVALADLAPLDTSDPGECEPAPPPEPADEPVEIPTPVADYLAEIDPQLREAFSDLHDLACSAGFEPEAEITGLDCPEHELGAVGITLRILGLLLFLWRSGALGSLVSSSQADEAAPPAPAPAPPVAAELPPEGISDTAPEDPSDVSSLGVASAPAISSAPPISAPIPIPACSVGSAGLSSTATADPVISQGMQKADPPSLSSTADALILATSAEPAALADADADTDERAEDPDTAPSGPALESLEGDRLTGWRLLDEATDPAGDLDLPWLGSALETAQDGADVLAALGASALLPISSPGVASMEEADLADLLALVDERLSQARAWGMVWGDAGDGYVVARPWVYLQSAPEAREVYQHRIPVEDWPDARRHWLDIEAATGLLLQRRDVLLGALYLDQESEPPELRPARTGAGNLGAHVSQLGTAEICALARIEAPGLVGLGSPAGWAALYSEDERVRIAYQRIKGHRDHLALQRRNNTTEAPEDRGWLGKLWSKQ